MHAGHAAAGLHIDHESVRIVAAGQGPRGWTVAAHTSVKVPPSELAGVTIRDPQALGARIASAWPDLGLGARQVVAAVPGAWATMSLASVGEPLPPPGLSRQLREPPDRYQVAAVRVTETRLLTVAVHKERLKSLLDTLSAAGLEPAAIDLDLAAAHRAIRYGLAGGAVSPGLQLLIFVGRSESAIALYAPDGLLHRQCVPAGLQPWSEEVARLISDSTEAGTKLLYAEGAGPGSMLHEALLPSLSLLQWGVEQALEAFPRDLPAWPLAGAFLCGEGAGIPGLPDVIDPVLPSRAVKTQPVCLAQRDPDAPDVPPAYACAFGLSLWPVDPP